MHVDLINNDGIITFRQEMQEQMIVTMSFSIATAFLTKEAIDLLKVFLSHNKNNLRKGRLLTGLYNCFNSKEDLLELRTLANKSKGTLEVHLSKNEKFHWKYYEFEHKNKFIAFIGSANFTSSGLNSSGELQAKFVINRTDKLVKENMQATFNKEWMNSEDIINVPLEKYQNITIPASIWGLDPSIRQLLFEREISVPKNDQLLPQRIVLINGFLSNSATKIISKNKSKWDMENWDYFSCKNKTDFNKFEKIKTIFIIYKEKRTYKFYIVDIKDKCTLKTTDGTYFVAYKERAKPKNETISIQKILEEQGIRYHSRNFADRNVGRRQGKILADLFSQGKV